MAIQWIGGWTERGSSLPSRAAPAHAAGDLIILTLTNLYSATEDWTPGEDWIQLYQSPDTSFKVRIWYLPSSPGAVTIPAFPPLSNAGRHCTVYRGHESLAPFGNITYNAANGVSRITFPENEFFWDNGTSWALALTRNNPAVDRGSPPANLTRRLVSTEPSSWYDSNGGIADYPLTLGPIQYSNGNPANFNYIAVVIELNERRNVFANLTATLDAVTLSSSALLLNDANLTATLDDVTLISAANGGRRADLEITLDDVWLESDTIQRYADLDQTLDDVWLESAASIEAGDLSADLVAEISVDLEAEASLDIQANLVSDIWVDLIASAATVQIQANAVINLDDVIVSASASTVALKANLDVTLDDVWLESNATITQPQDWPNRTECCTPSICDLDPCALICNFVSILPSGPMWDEPKRRVLEKYSSSQFCDIEDRDLGDCGTVVDHAVYTALKLYDILRTSLYPAIRESNPLTAFDTMDDWLDRLNWRSCVEDSCSTPIIDGLLPVQIIGPCGTYVCELPYEDCLIEYLKHATIVALTRLQFGGIKNLCFINSVIEPLGAVVFPTAGQGDDCSINLTIAPTRTTFPIWTKLDCLPQGAGECQAYHEPNKGGRTPLPDKVYPGLMTAECIIRSMLPPTVCYEFTRLCEIPDLIPNTCFPEM